MEYSVQKDAVFCYPCRHFAVSSGRSEKTFTETGFRDWKHTPGRNGILSTHDKCCAHKYAMTAWKQYQINVRHQPLLQISLA